MYALLGMEKPSTEEISAQTGENGSLADLVNAVVQNDVPTVKALLPQFPGVNFRNADGRTLAMFAAATGGLDVFQHLLDTGAELRLQDNDGFTPLHFAVMAGNLPMVQAVIKAGSSVGMSSFAGDTPLHYAAYLGRCAIQGVLVWHCILLPMNYYYL